jgi:hypothetical protein
VGWRWKGRGAVEGSRGGVRAGRRSEGVDKATGSGAKQQRRVVGLRAKHSKPSRGPSGSGNGGEGVRVCAWLRAPRCLAGSLIGCAAV